MLDTLILKLVEVKKQSKVEFKMEVIQKYRSLRLYWCLIYKVIFSCVRKVNLMKEE